MQLLPKPQHNHSSEPLELEESLEFATQLAILQTSEATEHANPKFALTQNSDRVVIFIDGSNLFYAASYLNIGIDYQKLLGCLTKGRRLIRAYFYTGVDRTNEKQQGFLLWMSRNGYRVVAKDLIQFPDGSKKANLDVEIAIDMLRLAKHCDTVVLLSGNGDLSYAVNAITYQGIQVEVISLRSMTNETLINVADRFIDLETIKQTIQRG